MSSALCLTFLLCITCLTFIHASQDKPSCPAKHSEWDKWYDGCNWCLCTENGPICTDKSCHRIPVDRCDPQGEKWRDGCYRCECHNYGIVCIADHRCVHAMRDRPFTCEARLGCVCGIDGVPSCIADSRQLELAALGYPKRRPDNKYVSNMPHWSKDRYIALTQEMTCRDAKRWYSGTQRCFCPNGENQEKCGEPRYIAHRIDGFRLKIGQCYKNQEWTHNCKTCMCHMEGIGFCVRIPNCKRKISEVDRQISVRECPESGSRWKNGCQYCTCNWDNKIVCDNYECNFSETIAKREVRVHMPRVVLGETMVRVTGGEKKPTAEKEKEKESVLPSAEHELVLKKDLPKFQIPPPHTYNMVRSFRKPAAITQVLCEGKYKPGEIFYIKCNLCKCGPKGIPKCTAILCV